MSDSGYIAGRAENIEIHILDFGLGNIAALGAYFERLGFSVHRVPIREVDQSKISVLVIPGVGNFDTVAQQFRTHNLGDFLQIYLEKGGKLIGICLGMQLLFETSDESNSSEGLSIIGGHVRHLGALQIIDVPQIGWAPIVGERLTLDEVFFAHSYYVDCPIEYVLLWRQAKDFRYPAAIMAEGVLGMQFHPEKSKGRADSLVLDFLNVGSVKK